MNQEKNYRGVIITEPSAEELKPSKELKAELRRLLEWEKRSEEIDWVIGEPCPYFFR